MTASTENHVSSTNTTTATEHNTRIESDYPEQSNKSPRSKDSHRGITIRGGGPASGRPRRSTRVVDLARPRSMIVSGWSGC